MNRIRIFYTTDIHGSNLCFRKFLSSVGTAYAPDVLIIGGDLSGKIIVPIVDNSDGTWSSNFEGRTRLFEEREQVKDFEHKLGEIGVYGYECTRSDADRLHLDGTEVAVRLKKERLIRWVEWADGHLEGSKTRIIVNTGNEDPIELDEVLKTSRKIEFAGDKGVIRLGDGLTLVSTSAVVGTAGSGRPAKLRESTEEELTLRIIDLTKGIDDYRKCIFNFHCPPKDTLLDQARVGVGTKNVGSSAIRKAIEELKPCVSLHGHIHESCGWQKLGDTVCLNPGTEYHNGILNGVYLEFTKGKLSKYMLTHENSTRVDDQNVLLHWRVLTGLASYVPGLKQWCEAKLDTAKSRASSETILNGVASQMQVLRREIARNREEIAEIKEIVRLLTPASTALASGSGHEAETEDDDRRRPT